MSRFSGAWAGLKLTTDVCDGGGTIEVSPERCPIREPELSFDGEPYQKVMQPRLIVPNSLRLEREIHERRLVAAREFARLNGLNEVKVSHPGDRLGIVTAGKAYYDLRSALRNLGIDEAALERWGIRILKLGLVYPLEPTIVSEFVKGLHQVIVIEEKRSFLELQLRELLYNANPRPAIYGKTDWDGKPFVPAHGELDAETISRCLARWLEPTPEIERRIAAIKVRDDRSPRQEKKVPPRAPGYCSGCPHNRSTLLLEGQIAGGGIGCHGMAARFGDNRGVAYLGQMGGEGASLDRHGAVHRPRAYFPEPRRRNLLPFRAPGGQCGGGGRGQHHFQDSLQRRGGDDRGPGGGGWTEHPGRLPASSKPPASARSICSPTIYRATKTALSSPSRPKSVRVKIWRMCWRI